MKRLIILMLFACFAFVSAEAQSRLEIKAFDLDTLTNAGTVDFDFPYSILTQEGYKYSWQIQADSLSGSTGATAYLQQSNDKTGSLWTTISGKTVTINGVQTLSILEGDFYGIRQRLRVIGTGTQSTKLKVSAVLRKM